jgi:hypothetical protein
MIDLGYQITVEDSNAKREPVTELAKKHAAKAFALAKDEVL